MVVAFAYVRMAVSLVDQAGVGAPAHSGFANDWRKHGETSGLRSPALPPFVKNSQKRT
jgi:hypothetical protein